MYIICKGSVAVIGKHNHMVGLLTVGQHFGEIALFTEVGCCLEKSSLERVRYSLRWGVALKRAVWRESALSTEVGCCLDKSISERLHYSLRWGVALKRAVWRECTLH